MSKLLRDIRKALRSSVRVKDVKTVRHFLEKGEHTSDKTYDAFCRITAETGALIVPFRELPEVKKILEDNK